MGDYQPSDAARPRFSIVFPARKESSESKRHWKTYAQYLEGQVFQESK
jgi:hypothetical protein